MSRGPSVLTIVLVSVLAGGAGALTAMLWPEFGGAGAAPSDSASITSEAPSGQPGPSASGDTSAGVDDPQDGPIPVSIDGELLPDGVPADVDAASFMGGTNAMSITIDGVVQRDDCAVVLMHVTPRVDITAFSLPSVGVVRDGLLYGSGSCDATGLIEAGYVSDFTKDRAAGETFAFFSAVPNPVGALTELEAVAVAVADGKFVFFEPTETTLP